LAFDRGCSCDADADGQPRRRDPWAARESRSTSLVPRSHHTPHSAHLALANQGASRLDTSELIRQVRQEVIYRPAHGWQGGARGETTVHAGIAYVYGRWPTNDPVACRFLMMIPLSQLSGTGLAQNLLASGCVQNLAAGISAKAGLTIVVIISCTGYTTSSGIYTRSLSPPSGHGHVSSPLRSTNPGGYTSRNRPPASPLDFYVP